MVTEPRRVARSRFLTAAIGLAALLASTMFTTVHAAGANYYVAPNGLPSNDGSQARPLDLATALSTSSPARPGDTIWLRGGVYAGNFVSVLNGADGAPIIVRQYPGERATLDGYPAPTSAVLTVKGSYTWFWGFEVMNSNTNRESGASSRGPGVAQFGAFTKLINLIVHDALDGIETWSGVTDGEVYGNVIYNNGGESGGVGAGHSIYVQNSTGIKRLVDNMMSNAYNFGIHVYTEGGTIDNISMEGNIAFNHGVLASSSSYKANYLVGGSKVAQNPQLIGNYGYYPFGSQGRNGDLGWGTACNNLNMQNNYFAGGTSLKVNCTNAAITGNFLYGSITSAIISAYPSNVMSIVRPTGVQTFVRPNKYEPGRAHVVVYNWDRFATVNVDLSTTGLKVGDGFDVRDAQNFFGPAVVSGTYNGSAVAFPMTGLTPAWPIGALTTAQPTGPEFNAFVVVPTGTSSSPPPPAPTAVFSAAPISIVAGQSSSLSWTTSNATSVSITPGVGSVSAAASVTVTPSTTTTYTLTASGSGGTVVKTAIVSVTPPSGGGGGGQSSATFVKADTTTQGTWIGRYGSDGFALAGDATRYPAYAQVAIGSAANWTWTDTTSDPTAVQKASGQGRIAAVWYAPGPSFTIDVTLTDGAAHQVGMYMLDWDNQNRGQTIQVTDLATGVQLDQRSAATFRSGTYLVWIVKGSVRFRITRTSGVNAVVNALFFDPQVGAPAPPPPPPSPAPTPGSATASFVKFDSTTQGSWINTYGLDGYSVAGDATNYPSYAQVTFGNASSWIWSLSTTEVRAVQKASNTGRLAATWYETSGSFTIDVKITDGLSHQVALYVLDMDGLKRAETIEITDLVSGALLDARALSSFANGTYAVWNVSGSVRMRVVCTQGPNAVVSALFFN